MREIGAIVRSTNERTHGLTRKILEREGLEVVLGGENFDASSFRDYFQRSLDLSLDTDWEWILHVDGDVLPFDNVTQSILELSLTLDPGVLCVQPKVFDKAFLAWRYAGVHLYRREALEVAMRKLGSLSQSSRPETSFLREADRSLGLRTHFAQAHFGVHDFEQSFEHLFKKSYAKTSKMRKWIPYLLALWNQFAQDRDMRVMKLGALAGLRKSVPGRFVGDVTVDYTWDSQWSERLESKFPTKLPVSPEHLEGVAERILATELRVLGVPGWSSRGMPESTSLKHTMPLLFSKKNRHQNS